MTHPKSALILIAALGSLSAGACALGPKPTTPPPGSSNLTAGMVKSEVREGVTTQAEILGMFGAPNIVTRNSDDQEVWNYNRMSFESTESESGVLAVLWKGWGGGAAGSRAATSTATTRSFDLILVFDGKDVVRSYKLISAVF